MKIKDMIDFAVRFTKCGDPQRDYLLGAIGERADGVVVMARNEPTKVKTPSCHAEARLANKLGLYAPLVIVVRVQKGDYSFAMAKPCVHCALAMKHHKVKKVLYTTDHGIERL